MRIATILVCALVLIFTGCATTKPPVATAPQPLRHFSVERVDSAGVVVSFPILLASSAMRDSSFQVYAAFYAFTGSAWSFMDGGDYKIATEKDFPQLYGRIKLPLEKGGEWYSIRVWAETTTGRRMFVSPYDPRAREDEFGRLGYESVLNLRTGKDYPVPKRE